MELASPLRRSRAPHEERTNEDRDPRRRDARLRVRDFHEVLTDDIAAGAGIGKATLYRYFGTKEDLYFATLLQGFDELDSAIAASDPDGTARARLQHVAREVLRVFWNRPCFYTLMHASELRLRARERLLDAAPRAFSLRVSRRSSTTGVAAGALRPLDVPARGRVLHGSRAGRLLFRRALGHARASLTEEIPPSLARRAGRMTPPLPRAPLPPSGARSCGARAPRRTRRSRPKRAGRRRRDAMPPAPTPAPPPPGDLTHGALTGPDDLTLRGHRRRAREQPRSRARAGSSRRPPPRTWAAAARRTTRPSRRTSPA